MTRRNSFILRYFALSIFRFAVRSAGQVYAISGPMASWLRSEFQVDATVQMPAGEVPRDVPPPEVGVSLSDEQVLRIAFAGTCAAADEPLKVLAAIVATGSALPDGRRVELHLYSPRPNSDPVWGHERIILHPWLAQADLMRALRAADILFLPYNFSGGDGYVAARSFPTKAADYMRSGRPILVMAPGSSAIVQYARQYGIAEIVDQCSKEMLLDAICRLAADEAHRSMLCEKALKVFKANHDIAVQQQETFHMIEHLLTCHR
jgi:glycosyltransferase involved in cell wall biosynthesis